VIDDYNHEGLDIEVGFSLSTARVIRALEQIIEWRGAPQAIRIEYTQPGKAQQNAHIERYNRTVRYEWLAHYLFDTIQEV
jgi:putative transposase